MWEGHAVDGRNPKQPPDMYETLTNNGDKLPTSTGFLAGLNHQQSEISVDPEWSTMPLRLRSAREARGLNPRDATTTIDADSVSKIMFQVTLKTGMTAGMCVCVVNTYANICYVQIYIIIILYIYIEYHCILYHNKSSNKHVHVHIITFTIQKNELTQNCIVPLSRGACTVHK